MGVHMKMCTCTAQPFWLLCSKSACVDMPVKFQNNFARLITIKCAHLQVGKLRYRTVIILVKHLKVNAKLCL